MTAKITARVYPLDSLTARHCVQKQECRKSRMDVTSLPVTHAANIGLCVQSVEVSPYGEEKYNQFSKLNKQM